ncbi:unnamed protein product, partial [Urochloa humidicola]
LGSTAPAAQPKEPTGIVVSPKPYPLTRRQQPHLTVALAAPTSASAAVDSRPPPSLQSLASPTLAQTPPSVSPLPAASPSRSNRVAHCSDAGQAGGRSGALAASLTVEKAQKVLCPSQMEAALVDLGARYAIDLEATGLTTLVFVYQREAN